MKLKAWLMARRSFLVQLFQAERLTQSCIVGMFDSPGAFERLGVLRMEFYEYWYAGEGGQHLTTIYQSTQNCIFVPTSTCRFISHFVA